MGNNVLSISIVLYNTKDWMLERVINSLGNENIQLYLVDNSPKKMAYSFCNDDRIIYIHNKRNIGFGAAHNIAIKKAIAENAKYHLVLNPDVYFKPEIIKKLIDFMDNNIDVCNIMPKVFYPDGSLQFLCKLLPSPYDWIGRRFNPFKKIVQKRNKLFELQFTDYNKIMEVPYLSGCFMFLRVDTLRQIGLFDENIFMYCEDTDLSRRIFAKSRAVYYPEVNIIHEFQKGPHKNIKLLFYNILSSIYYFNKWGWFCDSERKEINKKTLESLGYRK